MQMIWLMTMFLFVIVFFLIFFAVYFFRPRKDDKIIPLSLSEREYIDPDELVLPHRAEPNWPATIKTGTGDQIEATIVSVSHGSAFMKSTTRLAIGEKFQLTLNLPEREPLQLRAEVTWSNMQLPAEKVVNRGMGIRFIEAGEDAVCLISDTIARHGVELNVAEVPGSK